MSNQTEKTPMTAEQRSAVIRNLETQFSFKTNSRGKFFRRGKCPQCGEKSLYTSSLEPWVIQCGRLDGCKPAPYYATVRQLWPDLFSNYKERAIQEARKNNLPVSPNAVADLYLKEARGFDLEMIKGWYTQESYYSREKRLGSITVRFTFANTYWERLLENTEKDKLDRKANWKFDVDVAGTWWCPPSFKPDTVDRLWIVEGIFDAIALLHHSIYAVAIHGCTNYPDKALKELAASLAQRDKEAVTLVWALDGYGAGQENTEAFFNRATREGWTCEAAQIPQKNNKESKLDWNDMHIKGQLGEEHIAEYMYHGQLLTAPSAYEKALLMYRHDRLGNEFHLDYHNSMWWFFLNLDKLNKARKKIEEDEESDKAEGLTDEEIREKAIRQTAKVVRIAMFKTTALYFQLNQSTRVGHHYYQVEFPHKKRVVKAPFSASQISSPSEFKKRLLEIAPGPVYKATVMQHDSIIEKQIYDILCVDTVDYVGYAPDYKTYLLGKVAVHNGQLYRINKEDYFNLPGNLNLKTTGNNSFPLDINPKLEDENKEWPRLLWQAFGVQGYIALSFWFGTLFAEQIKETFKSMPFLEIVGDPNTGKTTLLNLFWKLFGRIYEGTNFEKDSPVARERKLAQVSNLPIAIIEADSKEKENSPYYKSFDWELFKNLYNYRASLRARGVATQGNEVYEPIFQGAIVIAQNNPIVGHEAIMQRICQLFYSRSSTNDKTLIAARKLEGISIDTLSQFILRAVMTENETMQIIKERVHQYEAEIMSYGEVKVQRLALNHAQIRAMADALAPLIGMSDEQLQQVHETLIKMAGRRQVAINLDSEIVQQFWDMYDYMHRPGSNMNGELNHSKKPEETIAINIHQFYEKARQFNQPLPDMTELKKALRESKYYKFLTYKAVDSAISGRTTRCFVFRTPSMVKGKA